MNCIQQRYLHCLIFILSTLSATSASGPLVFSVEEEHPVGTEVGVVVDEDSHQVSAGLRYRLRVSPSRRYFDLDELTGLLRTAEVLDREQLCPYQPFCELVIDVIGTPIIHAITYISTDDDADDNVDDECCCLPLTLYGHIKTVD